MKVERSDIEVASREQLLTDEFVLQVSRLLPEYVVAQRWYRAKARVIKDLRVADVIAMPDAQSFVFIVHIDYLDGEDDTYLLPLSIGNESEVRPADIVARLDDANGIERVLHSALSNAKFRYALLDAVACNAQFAGRSGGTIVASRTSALTLACGGGESKLESFVSRAEQSNTSIIFGDQYILKVFRKLESGVNPDLEIGRFLTERGFKYTPPVLGELEYRPPGGESMYAGILQGFVQNQGDAWKYTLESLSGFFKRALQTGAAPVLDTYHPLELCGEALPAVARQTIGEYIESARLLGNRTAQMHAALSDPDGGVDFAPEPFTHKYAQHLYAEMLDQQGSTFDLLRDKRNMLSGEAGQSAEKLLSLESAVQDRFSSLRERQITAMRIRHHGDFHLGQVLYTGSDFIIIDFEGEPARPLSHRRVKTLAMRDVAGMIRSFSYAGYAALFGQVAGVPLTHDAIDSVEAWASFWGTWVSTEYLKAYFETSGNAAFVGTEPEQHRFLFDAFVLQKALYEVSYELNNRPGWVQIPLHGILDLLT